MKNWRMKLTLAISALLFLASLGFDTLMWTGLFASGPDRDPPAVMVHPSGPVDAGETLIVGAQITDASGIGRVALWVRGEQEEEFRQIPMESIGDGQVQAKIEPWPGQGSVVSYYIEARDAKGNGPSFAGAPQAPYNIRLRGAVPAQATAQSNWPLWIVTAGSLLVLVGGYFSYRRIADNKLHADLNAELNRLTGFAQEAEVVAKAHAREPVRAKPRSYVPQDPAEQAFWVGLLAPLEFMSTFEREHKLVTMAARPHHHPTLGKRFFDVGTLTRHLEWVRQGDIRLTPDTVVDGQPSETPIDRGSSQA